MDLQITKRTLTLLIEFEQEKRPDWIWDSLRDCRKKHGFYIKIIGEGNQFKSDDDLDPWKHGDDE